MDEDLHVGRSFEGTDLEDGCPCPKAPCGLVPLDSADPECREHPPVRAKTLRQVHRANACPGPRTTPPAKPRRPATPECDRARKVQPATQAAGEFLEWAGSQGMLLGHYVDQDYGRFNPVPQTIENLLARWMGIDLDKVEQEKRAMLEWIREQQR